jgi:DNA-binding LacI/PurR family transcriptional regulator
MANIYDVARAARVSVATVSASVNGTAYVSRALKARVEAAVKQLGYHPNLVARSLATQQSHTIGMIAPNIANPFWPEVVRGVEDAAQARGYTLLLAGGDDDLEKEARYLTMFLAKRVDGILLTKAAGGLAPRVRAQLKASRTPVVQLMRSSKAIAGDTVLTDEPGGSYEAVAHLLRLSYRRIAMINGLPHVSTSKRRISGYRAALADWKVKFDPALVVHGDFWIESGYRAGLEVLKRKPQAVFIANYLMAVGFMRALKQYQLRCPDDIAIVTCDDHPWLDSFTPRLTTVNLPKYELGREGTSVLLDRIDEAGRDPAHRRKSRTIVLETSLVIRESCGYERRAFARAIEK